MTTSDVAIIGGGLTGLALAHHLQQSGVDFQLYEARERFGGRIHTLQFGGTGFDLGPSWFWHGQPRMAHITSDLNLSVFEQYSRGHLVYEDENGAVQRGGGLSPMEGSLRISGGMTALTDALVARLTAERLHLNSKLEQVTDKGTLTLENGTLLEAKRIVLCVPPRVAAIVSYLPKLTDTQATALENIPTWMGGQAKFVAVYKSPFWREEGLSGDAMSRAGPMVEIHDASPDDGSLGALFGFVGVPPQQRIVNSDLVQQAALEQLGRLFGPNALSPEKIAFQDWAVEPETASLLDHAPLSHHPAYGLPSELNSIWGERLTFCVTETASKMGGYMEGALARAEQVANQLKT